MMSGQLLQRLPVPELDEDVDAVVLEVVLMLASVQLHLPSEPHTGEVGRESSVDS